MQLVLAVTKLLLFPLFSVPYNCFGGGATSFLFTEYQYVGVFMVTFAILIFFFLGSVDSFSTKSQPCTYSPLKLCKLALVTAVFSTISFLLGAIISVVSGFLGMKIANATYANARTTLEARKGIGKVFITAFRSGAVMGFLLAANSFLVLYIIINLFKLYYGGDWEGQIEAITLVIGLVDPPWLYLEELMVVSILRLLLFLTHYLSPNL